MLSITITLTNDNKTKRCFKSVTKLISVMLSTFGSSNSRIMDGYSDLLYEWNSTTIAVYHTQHYGASKSNGLKKGRSRCRLGMDELTIWSSWNTKNHHSPVQIHEYWDFSPLIYLCNKLFWIWTLNIPWVFCQQHNQVHAYVFLLNPHQSSYIHHTAEHFHCYYISQS